VDVGWGCGGDLAALFAAAAAALALVLSHGPTPEAAAATEGVARWRTGVLWAGEALLKVIEHLVRNTDSARVRLRVTHLARQLTPFP